jgi:hypothetical protein
MVRRVDFWERAVLYVRAALKFGLPVVLKFVSQQVVRFETVKTVLNAICLHPTQLKHNAVKELLSHENAKPSLSRKKWIEAATSLSRRDNRQLSNASVLGLTRQ